MKQTTLIGRFMVVILGLYACIFLFPAVLLNTLQSRISLAVAFGIAVGLFLLYRLLPLFMKMIFRKQTTRETKQMVKTIDMFAKFEEYPRENYLS